MRPTLVDDGVKNDVFIKTYAIAKGIKEQNTQNSVDREVDESNEVDGCSPP